MSSAITSYKDAVAFKAERFNPVVLAENQRVKVILVCLEPGQFIPVHSSRGGHGARCPGRRRNVGSW